MTTTYKAPNTSAAAGVIAALDSPLRIAIISRLAERDHFVHELVKATGKSQPLILSLIHISEPTRLSLVSRMPSSA